MSNAPAGRTYGEVTIVFYAKDLARSEAFYRDVIGLDVTRNPGGEEGDWLMSRVRDGVTLVFFQMDEPAGRSPVVVFGLDEGGIDDVVEALADKGVEIVTPVSPSPGGWSSDFRDPDGHMLSYYQDAEAPRRL